MGRDCDAISDSSGVMDPARKSPPAAVRRIISLREILFAIILSLLITDRLKGCITDTQIRSLPLPPIDIVLRNSPRPITYRCNLVFNVPFWEWKKILCP
jgi:hypothetical protein